MNQVAYSISILEPISPSSVYNFNFPQSHEEFYRKMIPKRSIAVFHSTKIDTNVKKLNFILYNIKGESEIYVTKMHIYPDCNYDPKDFSGYIKPKRNKKI